MHVAPKAAAPGSTLDVAETLSRYEDRLFAARPEGGYSLVSPSTAMTMFERGEAVYVLSLGERDVARDDRTSTSQTRSHGHRAESSRESSQVAVSVAWTVQALSHPSQLAFVAASESPPPGILELPANGQPLMVYEAAESNERAKTRNQSGSGWSRTSRESTRSREEGAREWLL